MKIIRVASSNHFSRPSLHIPLLFLLLIDINSLKMATVVIIYVDNILFVKQPAPSLEEWKEDPHKWINYPLQRHVLFSTWKHSAEAVLHYWSLLSGVLKGHMSFQFGMLMHSKSHHTSHMTWNCGLGSDPCSAAQIFIFSSCTFVQCGLRSYILHILWV